MVARLRRKSNAAAKRGNFGTSPDGLFNDIWLSNTVRMVRVDKLKPASANDEIYKVIYPDDPTIVALRRDIAKNGVQEALIVSRDGVICSGHRRHIACLSEGITHVPFRRSSIKSTDPRFPAYLVFWNQQRVKTTPEIIREQVIRTSPEDAHNMLLIPRPEITSAFWAE
jgi:hypothetical protein